MSRLQATVGGSIAVAAIRWSITLQLNVPDATASQAQMNAAATGAMTAFAADTKVSGALSTSDTCDSVRLDLYPSLVPPSAVTGLSSHAAITGTGGGPQNVPSSCTALTILTGLPGRRYRGRVYWPMRVSGAQSGTVAGAGLTLVNTAVQACVDKTLAAWVAAGGGAGSWAVYSRVGAVMTPVTGVKIGNRLDTQRRRLDGLPEVYTPFSLI